MAEPSAAFLSRVDELYELRTHERGTFANESYLTRLPGLVRDVVALNGATLSPEKLQQLSKLADDLVTNAKIPLPSEIAADEATLAPTSAHWESLLAGKDYTWQNSPWFLGEQYMFHLVLLIAGYYSSKTDPFHPSKLAELEEATPWIFLENALVVSTAEAPAGAESAKWRHTRLLNMLKLALWGNKADGCYKEVKDTVSGENASLDQHEDLLLVDHSEQVISFLEKPREGPVTIQFINDNCGTELLLDLALVDHFLANKWCSSVTLNVKLEPMYVSDATPPDVTEHIAAMRAPTRSPIVQALGQRLEQYVARGALSVRPDALWNKYTYYWQMPGELRTRLARDATLVVIKGDLNYRRLLGDRIWPPSTPVEEAVPFFPTSFVSLRTLKSDPVVGIPPAIVSKLDVEDPKWRYNGKRGTIQSVLRE